MMELREAFLVLHERNVEKPLRNYSSKDSKIHLHNLNYHETFSFIAQLTYLR